MLREENPNDILGNKVLMLREENPNDILETKC